MDPEGMDTRAAIGTEVFANLFRGIVDEMAGVVLRSSHTTFVKETQDFSTGLVTPEGEMFATPTTSGATSNACTSMRAGTEAFDDWAPGDVLISNDPYTTGGMVMHLNDVFLFKPLFVEGRLICFAWAFIHCTDVGGSAPGSVDLRNHELFQEGVRLRPVKLYERGELRGEVWNFLADNSRIPALNWGDVGALKAAIDKAEDRLGRLCERHGSERVEAAMQATLDRSERLSRLALARIPAGSYRFVEYFEDDYVSDVPVRLQLELRADGEGQVTLDFNGSDPQVASALNLPAGGQRHHPFLCLALIHYVVTNAEGLHFNAGVVRPIELILPQASVVNSSFPAAVGMRYSTALRVHDLVLGALLQAVPEEVPAGGSGQLVVTYISTSELGARGRVVVANPVQGGSGGGAARDGVDAVNYGAAFLRNVPVEVVEAEAPVLVRRFALRADSEGAGRRRGGFGVDYELEVRHPRALVVMRGKDRYRFSSWGVAGGGPGASGSNVARRPGEPDFDIGKDQTVYRAALGETIAISAGGGGGFGDPRERPVADVVADCEDGLISAERAREVYGVLLGDDGSVDDEATAALRAELSVDEPDRSARSADLGDAAEFDFGPGRTAWETRFGATPRLLAERLPELPVGLRRAAQAEVYAALGRDGDGPYDEAAADAAIAGVFRSFTAMNREEGARTDAD